MSEPFRGAAGRASAPFLSVLSLPRPPSKPTNQPTKTKTKASGFSLPKQSRPAPAWSGSPFPPPAAGGGAPSARLHPQEKYERSRSSESSPSGARNPAFPASPPHPEPRVCFPSCGPPLPPQMPSAGLRTPTWRGPAPTGTEDKAARPASSVTLDGELPSR